MYKLLLATTDKDSFFDFTSALVTHGDIDLSWAESGAVALDMISNAPFDLVVAEEELGDMSGLNLAFKMLSVNPMINCAVTSSLSHDAFHEASEGLGLLAQLPVQPDENQAKHILQRLKDLKKLSAEMNIDPEQISGEKI